MRRLGILAVGLALAVGILVGAMLGNPLDDEASAAPAQQTEFEAESIMRQAQFEIVGTGGYSVYIWRNYWQGKDVSMVTFYGYGVMQMGTYVCLRDIGWDCQRW